MHKTLKLFAIICLNIFSSIEAINADALKATFAKSGNPFKYDLHVNVLPSHQQNAELLICMHGMGSDYTLAQIIKSNPAISQHIVGFNFPDHGSLNRDMMKTAYGTFDELAPAFFVLKKCIVDAGADKVHLYGFSAGGGAIINVLAILNSDQYNTALQNLGINFQEKQKILRAIQQGSVILEVPLKSIGELAEIYKDRDMEKLAERERKNGLSPIFNINKLQGLALNCFVYFSNPDEALGNRDDQKYIQLLKQANQKGQTVAIIGSTGGHLTYHAELWNAYKKFMQTKN